MKFGFVFAGAVLACAPFLSGAAAQTAPGGLVVAQNDQHHEEHGQHGNTTTGPQGHGPSGQSHTTGPGTMSGPMHMNGPGGQTHGPTTTGPNTMMGPSHMGGQNHMGNQGPSNATPMMGHGPSHHGNFDRHAFQRNFASPRHFHIGGYVRPQGWYSRHWGYGDILPAFFWTQNYWISDYYDYGLVAPPPGFVWVRDGDDALLVDTDTGEILQVVYGVFY